MGRILGTRPEDPRSLELYDQWYLSFYPYLEAYLASPTLASDSVLEVGLGYGTISQWLAARAGHFTGLDVAQGPVEMVRQRLSYANLDGEAVRGSILNAPFSDNRFDQIVAIGSLHHSGNLVQALSECHRMLRPGGRLVFMVYYAYSYRRWRHAPKASLMTLTKEMFGYRGVVPASSRTKDKALYDVNEDGDAPPHTDWVSRRSLMWMCREFASVNVITQNIDQDASLLRRRDRTGLLKSRWPGLWGLDAYCFANK